MALDLMSTLADIVYVKMVALAFDKAMPSLVPLRDTKKPTQLRSRKVFRI